VHGLVHVPVSGASDVALCGDIGEQVVEHLDVTCPVCVSYLKRRQQQRVERTI
jgi:hypothetical protein